VQTALAPGSMNAARLPAVETMLSIAQTQGWQDTRLGLSYFALGRVTGDTRAYETAASIFATLPDHGAHLAHALLPLAARAETPQQALTLVDQALPLAERAENAALMANFLWIKAEANAALGQQAAAAALRLDSLAAARYGMGPAQVRRAMAR